MTEIQWKLVPVDKALIKVNPYNPKIRNVQGFRRLEKLTSKYGVIFDGIINADYTLIDGHSRLELNPHGTGNYFMPSEQISAEDFTELSTLFDLAKAGDADFLLIEDLLSEEQMVEWELEKPEKVSQAVEKDIRYPIVPEFDERLDALIIVCTRQTDMSYIKNALGMDKMRSYKNKTVGESNVIKAADFISLWEKK